MATRSKNSSFCSEVMEEKTTVDKRDKGALMVRRQETLSGQRSWKDVETFKSRKYQNILESRRYTGSFVLFQLDQHESASLRGNKCISFIT